MDDLKVGMAIRAVRRRRGLRQTDVAALSGLSQNVVSQIERGQLEHVSLGSLRRVCSCLEVRIAVAPTWRGGQLDRLLDSRHAALVEQVVGILVSSGWEAIAEYTFNHFGERGSVDILAWQMQSRALLVFEIKSELDDMQDLLSTLDRKRRLVPGLVARERSWAAETVGVVLVVSEGSVSRAAVARHRATLGASLPDRNVAVKRWLASPRPPGLRGIWFLQPSAHSAVMEARGESRRVRKARRVARTVRSAPVATESAPVSGHSGASRPPDGHLTGRPDGRSP